MAEENNKTDTDLENQSPPPAYSAYNEMPSGEKKGAEEVVESKEVTESKEAPESEEDQLKSKYEELNDRFLRLYSEFENFRRRTARERLEQLKTAGEEIIVTLLPVLDDFDRAVKSSEESNDPNVLKEGVILVHNKFKSVLEQKGLEQMDSLGKTFDTDNHEAISEIPAPKNKLKGKVVDVVGKGYFLNGKVIRHAKVIVGS